MNRLRHCRNYHKSISKLLSDEENLEFQSTKSLLPNIKPVSKVDALWYIRHKGYPEIKGKFNQNYLDNVLSSAINDEKCLYKLKRITSKLSNPPTHKLRRITGTSNWLYVIKTPWNRDLRTENFKMLGDLRKRYDEIMVQLQQCNSENDKNRYDTNDDDSKWLVETAQNQLKNEKNKIEQQVIQFCKRQGVIYDKIKPEFDKLHIQAKDNISLLHKELSNETTSPGTYTDVIDGGIKGLLTKYGFRS